MRLINYPAVVQQEGTQLRPKHPCPGVQNSHPCSRITREVASIKAESVRSPQGRLKTPALVGEGHQQGREGTISFYLFICGTGD